MVATVNSRSSAKRRVNSTSSLARHLAATGRLATMDAGGAFAWEYLAGTDLKSALDYPNGARTEYTYESGRDILTNVRNEKGGTVYSNSPYNVYKEFVWDPTESVATKPLCFRQHNQSDAYLMHDGNKNVTDVIAASAAATQLAHYDYAPFGAVRAQSGSRASANPYRFSSEFADDTLGLVYYNYRHYDPTTGRWLSRDPIEGVEFKFDLEISDFYNTPSECLFNENSPLYRIDLVGLLRDCEAEHNECFANCWKRNPPWPITKGKEGHYRYCTTTCLESYMKCVSENAAEKVFDCFCTAIEWINQNKVMIGSVVVVGGVTYIVVTGGLGSLALVPLL